MRRAPDRLALPAVFLLFALALAASACVQIDGGAVEVSWVVHADGRAITDCSCSSPEIARVRIQMVGQGGAIQGAMPCAGQAACEFACQRQTGATPFDIPETHGDEQYAISLVAVGQDGADLPQVQAPAPILRSVVKGQPTEVEAFLLEAGCASDCEVNTTAVCERP
jgi:hypothetical protein